MKQQAIVAKQFGETAHAYLTSSVHAEGQDLKNILQIVRQHENPKVLDVGCGAGHVAFVVAPAAKTVTAYDLSHDMLSVVARSAKERNLHNIATLQGPAEKLPFEDEAFDLVLTRFSAHHWLDLPAALCEINRVLAKDGVAVFVDVIAPEFALHDTTLQAVEVLRDVSHVRDYRISEWENMLSAAGFDCERPSTWKLAMVFNEWIERMRTPQVRVEAIRNLFDCASQESLNYFSVEKDHSFSIDAALFKVRKEKRAI